MRNAEQNHRIVDTRTRLCANQTLPSFSTSSILAPSRLRKGDRLSAYLGKEQIASFKNRHTCDAFFPKAHFNIRLALQPADGKNHHYRQLQDSADPSFKFDIALMNWDWIKANTGKTLGSERPRPFRRTRRSTSATRIFENQVSSFFRDRDYRRIGIA